MSEATGTATHRGDLGPTPRRSPVWRDARTTLAQWVPPDAEQGRLRAVFLDVLEDDAAVFKSGPPVHLTASCIVLDRTGERVLLTLHTKARSWLQFGGHIESVDPTLLAAARREVREESGVDGIEVDPSVLELHRHALGARFGRCTEHLDVRFVGHAPLDVEPRRSPESLDVRWWPIAALPTDVVSDIGPLIDRARTRPRRGGLTLPQ